MTNSKLLVPTLAVTAEIQPFKDILPDSVQIEKLIFYSF